MRRCALLPLVSLVAGAACSPGPTAGTRPGAAAAADVTPARATEGPDPEAARASPLADAQHVGSGRCQPCHAAIHEQWRQSSHATTVRAASLGDEDMLNDMIQCSGMDLTHVMGDRHHVRFLREVPETAWGDGRWLALPCGWDVHDKEVTLHHVRTWETLPWESGCAACHTTGFRRDDHGFAELGVGCEECHGPGSRHADTADTTAIVGIGGLSAAEEVTICASCHLQDGRSRRTGLKFPDGYLPGASLFDDYRFDWAQLDDEARDAALDAHQKILVRQVVFEGQDDMRCTSCHGFHDLGHETHRTNPPVDLCFLCHESDFTLKEYSQSCNVCEF